MRVDGVGGSIFRVPCARLARVRAAAAAVIKMTQSSALDSLSLVEMRRIIAVLFMLLLLWEMVRMLVMMLAHCGAIVSSLISGGPIESRIRIISRSGGAAVSPRSVNGRRRDAWSRVEGARSYGEALMLIQRVMGVRQVMVMMKIVVSRFRHRVSAGPWSVTDAVFHKRVHVVHAERMHCVQETAGKKSEHLKKKYGCHIDLFPNYVIR